MEIFEIASLITSICSVIVAVIACFIAKKTLFTDHKRRKEQATIEYYNNISNTAVFNLRTAICKALNETLISYSYSPILPSDPIWKDNTDLQYSFFYYCRNMERFAVGIKENIFDFETFYRFAGKSTAQLFRQIQPLIEDRATNEIGGFGEEFKKFYADLMRHHYSSGKET